MLLFQTKDLFFVPVVKSAAAAQGLELATVLNCDSPKLETLDAALIRICLVDLSSVPVSKIAETAASYRARFPAAQLIGFGPHVQTQRLEAARAAGFDHVLSRGQLDHQLADLLPVWRAEADAKAS
ncbi:hypothetical protein [Aureliella helgolandensis]|uniref:Response regulatory domain-containing protein n=1 Tax=Aureliella helgolandensis TaxID=2527968 RepID=A0A518G7X8_9BACT|nr:hypothetical protein [Aureliella helgolandensis]QDV24690.1 hypothetical protein Q31a_30110 [Aureliella helgolandensis]